MKLLRKNQIVITALVIMVALAGYLSVTDKEELSMTSVDESVTDPEVADISEEDIVLDEGDAVSGVSVSAIDGETTEVSTNNIASRENAGEAVLVSNNVGMNYFEEAKLSREQIRAKNKETLTELINNKNATEDQKTKAMNEIMEMTTINEKEMATENLLAAKGFKEAVVTILEEGVDVVVNAENLTEQQIAQIEDVVKRKTECSPDKIVISPVGKSN